MPELLDLHEMENDEHELVPEILPVDARLAIVGSATTLASLFSSATAIAPLKEIIPNTSHVLFEAFDQTDKAVSYVQVSATDGERSIAVLDDTASVKLAGEALLPGRRVLEVLKLVPEDNIRIDVIGTNATIRSGRAVWTIATPPTSYTLPDFASGEDIEYHSIETKSMLTALELIYPAVSKTTARQSLMQANVKNGAITSCDGVRVHRVSVEGLTKDFSTTIPVRFIETAIRELKHHSGEVVEFGSNTNTVIFNLGKNILMSQRSSFAFPNVDHLVLGPALANEEILTVSVKDLIAAIKRVRINADPDFFALFLSLRPAKDSWTLTVRARDKHGNASQETLEASYEGPALAKDLVVNHHYVLDFLSCVAEPAVDLRLGEFTKNKQPPLYITSDKFTGALSTMAPNVVK